ncbi:MAG: NAD-dependent epimerase/dehydratase family protein [Bryobacteraceae bacterium]|jgi:nucleoside-diphosphate-sugar epimerase
MKDELVVVTGGGGFIGGSLVADLRRQGCQKIRAVDIKPFEEWYQCFDDVENLPLDLNIKENCETAARGACQIFNLAAHMGGKGFIEHNKALCMLSVLINTHMLQAALKFGVQRYFYSSSACVHNGEKQTDPDSPALKEEDAYPALSEDGCGWEKLFSERICRHFREDFGLCTRVARFHMIMDSNIRDPINRGSSELVSIEQLVGLVEEIAGIKLNRRYNLSAPKGVAGRNSDNTHIKQYLNWEPNIPLRVGLEKTYAWIYDQYVEREKRCQACR